MSVIWNDKKAEFKITPNPSLIISVNNNGENEMEEEVNKSPNMWDSILVDVIAEFDNVKLTLGELKEISEGLVIDLGSVYDNKIKLRVENQIVATGELVILNDRYGVKIESIKKSKEPQKPKPAPPPQPAPAAPPKGVKEQAPPQPAPAAAAKKRPPVNPKQPAKPAQPANKNEDKNFDYSDFEIEDESI
ncbi:MAG: FliM/FliN family flagellar motor C-terminal domain-containing protein [Candidatus Gastranaerophilales bacterium]|nr:FliM/FliN family flagellar motor C-terminal domain-containing protein [Candidatus Gastranaerophilales bacterium]